jgi:uncharacterized protein YbjT (DUF2867 family)
VAGSGGGEQRAALGAGAAPEGEPRVEVVTGAFGYIGRYIARHLLDAGRSVRTITTHPDKPNPFGSSVEAFPFRFDRPDEMVASLRGASTLYNTYWIRFEHGGATFDQAVRNTATLFDCARKAGVAKIVHISVTHASPESPLPYYRGKALQERALIESGVPYAIVRPTLVFGREDILVNNIAWLIRRFPVFPIFGSGAYALQPVFVGDLAAIAVACARETRPQVIDAIGPERYSFRDFVARIADRIKPGVKLIHVPPGLGIALGGLVGVAMRDVVLTAAELRGLMDEMLTSVQEPNAPTRFSAWLESHHAELGVAYTSELDRHFRWRRNAWTA